MRCSFETSALLDRCGTREGRRLTDYWTAAKQGAGIASAVWGHPANRQRRMRAWLTFLGWQLYKRALRKPRVIDFHGKKLKCYTDSTSTSAALYFNGLADYWE